MNHKLGIAIFIVIVGVLLYFSWPLLVIFLLPAPTFQAYGSGYPIYAGSCSRSASQITCSGSISPSQVNAPYWSSPIQPACLLFDNSQSNLQSTDLPNLSGQITYNGNFVGAPVVLLFYPAQSAIQTDVTYADYKPGLVTTVLHNAFVLCGGVTAASGGIQGASLNIQVSPSGGTNGGSVSIQTTLTLTSPTTSTTTSSLVADCRTAGCVGGQLCTPSGGTYQCISPVVTTTTSSQTAQADCRTTGCPGGQLCVSSAGIYQCQLPSVQTCPNGAISSSYPSCNICPNSTVLINNQCTQLGITTSTTTSTSSTTTPAPSPQPSTPNYLLYGGIIVVAVAVLLYGLKRKFHK